MLTLLEWAKLSQNPLQSGVMEEFGLTNPVLERMPFLDINGNAFTWNKEKTLPGIAFRGINEGFTESTGVVQQFTESLRQIGGDSDVDTALIAASTSENDVRQIHDSMKTKSLSLSWLRFFFDGDSESNPKEFDGLNKRLVGNQVINAGTGGAELTLDMVDDLVDAVVGTPGVILANKRMRRKITKLGQSTNNVTFGIDALGRPVTSYGGIPIDLVEEDETGTDVLAFDEDDGSSNLDTASIYALTFGPDRVVGIQNGPMNVRDFGELELKPAKRTRVEWFSSYLIRHSRAAARLNHVNDA